ncbi:MAG TPA: response regulator [Oligoflexus sp.]|uniref:response regulator n=1 Tax=Oligoflexus sp. TaxID=1971216 RepID=UPI002D2DE2CC|nr:response regulator [Oligoflexus sp.]HYX37011.1 response regulator [Oligoflexus sp.]
MTKTQPISVLVVDDEPLLGALSFVLLTEKGFQVSVAHSFTSALSVLKHSPIDVVITDVQMPHGSGIDLLCEINQMEGKKPAVFLASTFAKMSTDDSQRLGAVDFLDKPLNFDLLARKIVRAYRIRKSTRTLH